MKIGNLILKQIFITTPLIVATMRGVNLWINFYAFLYALKSIAKSLPLIMPSALTSAKAT